ncbi:MAG: tRNA (guanosine(46)-N7)-methyltransferase TrmB [bacterium]|nr:tRNA (guanosine(46)-N7)-methyltransferase TrmB [bacterium]
MEIMTLKIINPYKHIIFPFNHFPKLNDFYLLLKPKFIETKELFNKDSNLYIEIGFGKGDFLINFAKNNKDKTIIGIERSQSLVKEVSKKLVLNKIDNVKLIEGLAEFVFYFYIPHNSVELLIINFPDPYPKKAHINRRLLNKKFFKLIYPKLTNNALIYIATDCDKYRDYIIQELKTLNIYKIEKFILGFYDENYQTKYLKKWLKLNKKIYSFIISKKV